jgi:hypothetical protein
MSTRDSVAVDARIAAMTAAATNLLAELEPDARSAMRYGFDDDAERRSWFYTPTRHGGVAIRDLDSPVQQRAFQLLATGLSAGGYNTAVLVMGTENILDRLDGWFPPRFGGRGRDPGWYTISIFGEPGADRWGWRFGGHHVSLHYTIAGRHLRATPNFIGIDPASSPLIGGYSFRPLAGMEDIAHDLAQSLTPAQQGDGILSEVAPFDLVTGNRPHIREGDRPPQAWQTYRDEPAEPRLTELKRLEERALEQAGMREEHLARLEWARKPMGLPVSSMTERQREMLDRIVEQYLGRLPDDLAEHESRRLVGTGEDLHFAWAGDVRPREPHYYRVHGERLVIEYDSFHRDGAHIHSVWRDMGGDFGDDILTDHISHEH